MWPVDFMILGVMPYTKKIVLSVTPKGDYVVLYSRTWRFDCLWHFSPNAINIHKLDTKKVTV